MLLEFRLPPTHPHQELVHIRTKCKTGSIGKPTHEFLAENAAGSHGWCKMSIWKKVEDSILCTQTAVKLI